MLKNAVFDVNTLGLGTSLRILGNKWSNPNINRSLSPALRYFSNSIFAGEGALMADLDFLYFESSGSSFSTFFICMYLFEHYSYYWLINTQFHWVGFRIDSISFLIQTSSVENPYMNHKCPYIRYALRSPPYTLGNLWRYTHPPSPSLAGVSLTPQSPVPVAAAQTSLQTLSCDRNSSKVWQNSR